MSDGWASGEYTVYYRNEITGPSPDNLRIQYWNEFLRDPTPQRSFKVILTRLCNFVYSDTTELSNLNAMYN